jgi:hypothetical protein
MSKDDLVGKISSFSPNGIPEEQTIGSILLTRQIKNGKRIGFAITLREQDIPENHPEYKTWVGNQFIKWTDGGWNGGAVGSVYGILGGILDKALEAQIKEDDENKAKGEKSGQS